MRALRSLPISLLGVGPGWILAVIGAAIGYLIPSLVLGRLTELRKREIREGLPDALDLFIVCVEAGCGLDQAIVKASDELGLTYPALTYELRLITTEIRAGKSRMEAFKNFAARTQVDDVKSLVALLVQTDKFGTSIAQALRTHAETSRIKRRQRRRGTRRQDRRQAGISACALPLPGALHRHSGPRGHQFRSSVRRRRQLIVNKGDMKWIPLLWFCSPCSALCSCSTSLVATARLNQED